MMVTHSLPQSVSSSPASVPDGPPLHEAAQARTARSARDSREHVTRTALLVLPAYIALSLAIGSACYALTHYVATNTFTFTFFGALLVSLVTAYGANCGGPTLRRVFQSLKALLIVVWLPLTMVSNVHIFLPTDVMAEANTTVAALMGLAVIVSVAVIGLRIEGRLVPLSAPLVPTLSLFGLLNIIMVDTIVQICFLVFVACALYLVAYERMLLRLASDAAPEASERASAAPDSPGSSGLRDTAGKRMGDTAPGAHTSLAAWGRSVGWKAGQYLLACSLWFGIFIGGAGLLYYPLHALMPGVLPAPGDRIRRAAQNFVMDWRRPGSVLELQGGTHTLSAQPMLRVRLLQGQPSGLWRGRVYETYQGSLWEDVEQYQKASVVTLKYHKLTPLPDNGLPPASPLVRQRSVVESIEPIAPMPSNLYTGGHPVAVQAPTDFDGWSQVRVRPVGTISIVGLRGNRFPYIVESKVLEPRMELAAAPGLSVAASAAWRRDAATKATLELPDGEAAAQIQAIADEIVQAARASGQPLSTPEQKVQAVGRYLIETCTYALTAPRVPITEDAVVFFLTDSRQGACDMFASSMALLLRAMDVPTRLVTGYLGTEPDADESATLVLAENGPTLAAKTTFVLRERDAHAWVEYYVPQAGWLSYDPSAGTRTVPTGLSTRLAGILHLNELVPHWRILGIVVLGLLLLITGGVWSWLDRRKPRLSEAGVIREAERRRIAQAYDQAVRLLARRVPRPAHYTPLEYENAVSRAALPSATKLEFAALTHLFVAAHYASPPAVVDADLHACLQRLRRSLS